MPTDTDLIRNASDALETARPDYQRWDGYLSNKPIGASSFIAPELRAEFAGRVQAVVPNFSRLVVRSIAERLEVVGFRVGDAPTPDRSIWDVWSGQRLDLGSGQAHEQCLAYGRSPVIVWSAGEPGTVRVSVESARQVHVEYDAADHRPVSAVKLWHDHVVGPAGTERGYGRAVVYLPDRITSYRSRAKLPETGGTPPATGWVEDAVVPNPLGEVPVVELINRADLLGHGESELVDARPIVDALVKLLTDLMISSEFSSMPRRWLTGMALPEDPDTGEPDTAKAFNATAGRTWFAEEPEARFGQFPEAELAGYVSAVELMVQQLSSTCSIPAHYLNSLTGQMPSAESLRAAEASLISKVKARQLAFGHAWEDVARLVVLVRDGIAPPGPITALWADAESRTDSEAADAALKRAQLGVPQEQLWADLGYTPEQIAAMRGQRRSAVLDTQGLDLDRLLGGNGAPAA